MDSKPVNLPPDNGLPPLLQTLVYIRDPVATFRQCSEKLGDWYTLNFFRFQPLVVTSSPEAVRILLKLAGEEAMHQDVGIDPIFKPLVGNYSIPILDGDLHITHRRIMLLAFQRAKLQSYYPMMRHVCDACLSDWQPGDTYVLQDELRKLGLKVLLRTVFGLPDGPETERLYRLIMDYSNALINPLTLVAAISPLFRYPASPWRKTLGHLSALRQYMDDEIRRFRSGISTPLGDICEQFGALPDEELRDELVTLFTAGTDTSANTATWCLYDILARPDCLEKVLDEINRPGVDNGDVGDTPYLDAVIQESMRLHPITIGLARRLKKALSVDGFNLPEGTLITTDQFAYNTHGKLWSEPDVFRPERFLEPDTRNIPSLAFGGGMRRCIGHAYALQEIRIMVCAILGRFTLRLESNECPKTVTHGVLFGPEGGVRAKVVAKAE